jgi:hypothetical protein
MKHLGESNLKHKWIEYEEKEEEDLNSTSMRKKFKGT